MNPPVISDKEQQGGNSGYPVYTQVPIVQPIPMNPPNSENPNMSPQVFLVSPAGSLQQIPSSPYSTPGYMPPQQVNYPSPQQVNYPPQQQPNYPPQQQMNYPPQQPNYPPQQQMNYPPQQQMNPPPPRPSQGPSPYPQVQRPRGPSILIQVDYDNKEVKTKNTAIGVGVGAATCILTGGIGLPVLAGALVYNSLKKKGYSEYTGYGNSFVYELRVAISKELKVKPELVLLQYEKMIMDDNEQLFKYFKKSIKVNIKASVNNVPVAGSNFYAPNGAFYPPSKTVSLTKSGNSK